MSTNLEPLLRERLTIAMKERDVVAMRALRTTLGAIDNATGDDVRDLVVTEIGELRSAARSFSRIGHKEYVKRLRAEAAVLEAVLAEAS